MRSALSKSLVASLVMRLARDRSRPDPDGPGRNPGVPEIALAALILPQKVRGVLRLGGDYQVGVTFRQAQVFK